MVLVSPSGGGPHERRRQRHSRVTGLCGALVPTAPNRPGEAGVHAQKFYGAVNFSVAAVSAASTLAVSPRASAARICRRKAAIKSSVLSGVEAA